MRGYKKIHDIPKRDRPREKLQHKRSKALSDLKKLLNDLRTVCPLVERAGGSETSVPSDPNPAELYVAK
jgi:hypothetical protein